MAQESKKPIVKDEVTLPVDLEQDQSHRALATQQQVDNYLQRKAAVTETDREAFQDYLTRKAEAMPPRQSRAHCRPTATAAIQPSCNAEDGRGDGRCGRSGLGYVFGGDRRIGFQSGRQAWGRSLHRSSTPQHRPPARRSEGGRRRSEPRKMDRAASDQDGRRCVRAGPQHESGAGFGLVLELRRFQSDRPPPVRVSECRSVSFLRVRQQHAGRQELPDLRDQHQDHRRPAPGSTSIA